MLLSLLLALSLAPGTVAGVVKDPTGAVVSGAAVTIRSVSGAEQQTVTGPDGRFTFDNAPDGESTVTVRAGGFGVKRETVTQPAEIEIVLAPAAILESVT